MRLARVTCARSTRAAFADKHRAARMQAYPLEPRPRDHEILAHLNCGGDRCGPFCTSFSSTPKSRTTRGTSGEPPPRSGHVFTSSIRLVSIWTRKRDVARGSTIGISSIAWSTRPGMRSLRKSIPREAACGDSPRGFRSPTSTRRFSTATTSSLGRNRRASGRRSPRGLPPHTEQITSFPFRCPVVTAFEASTSRRRPLLRALRRCGKSGRCAADHLPRPAPDGRQSRSRGRARQRVY